MATGIQIDSELNLITKKAEQQLQSLASGVKPVFLPINFTSEAIEKKVAELKKVAFDWSVTPDIEFKAIANLQNIVGEIQQQSQFKIVPDVGFVEINQLKKDIEAIRARSTIDVLADVNFAEVERLKTEFAELRSQSEVRLKIASDAQDITIGNSGQKYGEEISSQAKEQVELLSEVIKEQRNTQKTVKAESAVSLGNFIKGKLAGSAFDAAKNAAVATFDIDTGFFEKALNNILPSTKILAADLKDMAAKFDEASGGSKRVKKLVDDLLVGFADASLGAESIEEISDRFKQSAKDSFGEFQTELDKTKDKFSSFQEVLKAIGINTDALEASILQTKTGGAVARGLSKTLDRPLGERKDRIQTERLGNVLDRATELSEQNVKEVSKSARRLGSSYKNALAAVDDELEELVLVIGGLATDPRSGIGRAIEINKQLESVGKLGKSAAVGFQNPEGYRPKGLSIKQGFPLAVARPNLKGFSGDAEEIAAQAIAALTKNPNLKIKLVGESGGGFAVEEAVQILNKLGFSDRVLGAGFGTPSLKAKASKNSNFQAFLGTNKQEALGYEVKNLFASLGLVSPEATRRNPQVAQDLKGLEGHTIDNYYGLAEFREFVLNDNTGREQTRATINDIKTLREKVLEKILGGSIDEAIALIDNVEDNIRVTGDSREPFDQLKTDVADLTNDVEKGIVGQIDNIKAGINAATSKFDNESFEGNVDFFNELRKDIPKIELLLKKLGLDSSKITKSLIDDLGQDLTELKTQIPIYQSPELLKADYIGRRADQVLSTLSEIDPEDAIRTITDIEPTIKQYLAQVRSLDDSEDKAAIQATLESQLKTIKTAKKLALLAIEFDFKELVKNPGEYLNLIKDASIAKAKETAKKKSLTVAQELATKTTAIADNFIEDFKDRLLEAVEIIKAKALPGADANTPLLSGDKGSAIVPSAKGELTEAGQALLVRAIADTVVAGKNTYDILQRLEKGLFDIFPILRAGKAITQTAAPVIGGVALASQSPELAALAKLSAQELAIVIQPLIQASGGAIGDLAGNIPGLGGGARAAIQFLANNSALTSSAATGIGSLTAFGALGGGAGAIAKSGARLAGRKTFDALPESLKTQLTPEAIAAFDNLVATRQQEIKQLAGSLNKELAALKGSDSKEGTQKLLAGYQQLNEEIQELEVAVNSNNKTALKRTRDRIKELKGIQKGIRTAINKTATKGKKVVSTTLESIFDVEITPANSKDVSKKTLQSAIADYKQEIIAHRKKLEKKILDGSAVDSDFQAGAELARRGQALSASLKQRRGFSKEARGLSQVSNTLAGKATVPDDAIKAGDEVINGILQGTNQKLAQVFVQGRTLGIELLDGFKQELEIKSPSGKFIKGMSEVAAGIIEGRKRERDRIRAAGEDIGEDLYGGSRLALGEYQNLLTNLEILIKQKDSLQSSTFQQAFDFPDSDISSQLEQINQLEQEITNTADAIASFQEGVEIEVEFAEIEEPELPELEPIEVEVETNDDELNNFLNNIPDDIELDVEADTGNSSQVLNRLDRNLERVRNTARTALKAIIGFGLVRLSGAITNQLEDIVRQSIETQIKFEQLETSINFVAGSAEEGAKSLEFVSDTARRLKIDLAVATDGYRQLAAAARKTELEDETDRLFNSVLQASRVFGLSAEQTDGAILAIGQSISKGVVSMEELRRQLGDRIPGTMQIAARAMNMTTAELDKLVSTGQLSATEFWSKFARQLESETRGGVTGAINTTGAALQRLRSSYTQFQLDLAKTTKPAQIALYTTLAESIELAGNNLNILIPASKILSATLITLFLPAIVSLVGVLKTAIATYLPKLLTLLNANTASMSAFAKAARVATAALKAFIIIEAISQAIALTHNLVTINQEAKDAVKDLDKTYQEFLGNLSKNNPDNVFLKEELIKANQEKIRGELGKTAKFIDFINNKLTNQKIRKGGGIFGIDLTPKFIKDLPGIGKNISESVVDDADELTKQAIKKATKNLDNIFFDVGVILEADDDVLQNAVDSINRNISNLDLVNPTSIETLDSLTQALDYQKELLKEYNDELLRRGGLSKSLARIEVVRSAAVDDAVSAEQNGINALNQEILESGDIKRNIELEKLNLAKTRIDEELKAEKKAIAESESFVRQRNADKIAEETEKLQSQLKSGAISSRDFALGVEELNKQLNGIDPDTGFLKGLSDKELENARKRSDRYAELQSNSIDNAVALANEEVESKLRIYDEYLEEIETRRQEAEDNAIASEKERLIQIQQLLNDDVITTEQADELKSASSKEQVASQLKEEKKKLRQLKRFKSDEVAAQEKADQDISTSKSKILDLTLSLLEQEKQAEEKTIAAISKARDDYYSKIESNLNRLSQIQQTEAGLISDRNSALEKLADLEISKLRQGLELRKQLNSGDLSADERRTTLRQLHSLGIEGRTSELGLLNQIEDKEKAIAEAKLRNLETQQVIAQEQLKIEIEQLKIANDRAKIESEKGLIEAEKEVNSAEFALAQATTPEEIKQADELYSFALRNLKLAEKEAELSQIVLNTEDKVIARKKDNLALTQAIARAELKGTTQEQEFELERQRNAAIEESDRRNNNNIKRYLSRQEKIDEQVRSQESKVKSSGGEFTEEDESKLRQRLNRQFDRQEGRQESGVKRSLQGTSFTIEAPPEILEAIKSGKPFVVPTVPSLKSTSDLQTEIVKTTSGSLGEDNMILKTLKNIETKFKQPTVIQVQNDNNFTNVYDKSSSDDVPRIVRSEITEMLNTIESEVYGGI